MPITIDEMLANAVHYGHRATKWNPRMKPYIYSEINGIHLFQLEKTKDHLEKLLEYIKRIIEEGKTILMVSTKPQTAEMIPRLAEIHDFPFVTKKWFGGTLTNFDTMKERIRYYKNLKEQQETGEFEKFTKQERVNLEKEIEKLGNALGGIQGMRRLPEALFIVDGKRDLIAIREARKLKIPVIGICDTNADPLLYDLFVPANDDAMKSLQYLLGKVEEIFKLVPKRKEKSPIKG